MRALARRAARTRRSEYKQRYTVKILVGISPCGMITYVSEAFPGSITDFKIVEATGMLDMLERGDAIMADRGFKIWRLTIPRGQRLIVPACTFMGKGGREALPMTSQEGLRTYQIANMRIHVERAMKEIKLGWRMLHSDLPRARVRLISALVGICARMSSAHCPVQPGKWVR